MIELLGYTIVRVDRLMNAERNAVTATEAFTKWRDECVKLKNRLAKAGLLTPEEQLARGVHPYDATKTDDYCDE